MPFPTRPSLSLAGALLVCLAPSSPAVARSAFPHTVPLPPGSQREGITSGLRSPSRDTP